MAGTPYVVSISDLRTSSAAYITNPNAEDIFYVNDGQRQGEFYFDDYYAGTDNDGTVFVNTNTGATFRRILVDDPINVQWFGATGEGTGYLYG